MKANEPSYTLPGESEALHLVYNANEGYLPYVLISAASALAGLPQEKRPFFHLLCPDISETSWQSLTANLSHFHPQVRCLKHVVDEAVFGKAKGYKGNRIALYRLLTPDRLPDADWAVYADADTYFVGDLSVLLSERDESCYLQAQPIQAQDTREKIECRFRHYGIRIPEEKTPVSVCSGFMLMNLKKMRENKITERCIEFLQNFPEDHDETALHAVIMPENPEAIGVLPSNWGLWSMLDSLNNQPHACIHMISDPPWAKIKGRFLSQFDALWWDFVRMFGFEAMLRTRCGFPSYYHLKYSLAVHLLPFIKPFFPFLRLRSERKTFDAVPRRTRKIILNTWKKRRNEMQSAFHP